MDTARVCGPDALVQGMEEQRRASQPFEPMKSAQRRQMDSKQVKNTNRSRLKVCFDGVGRGGKHASLFRSFEFNVHKEEKKEGTRGIERVEGTQHRKRLFFEYSRLKEPRGRMYRDRAGGIRRKDVG